MATQQRYRLKLSRLDFISPVDEPAQQTAKVCLIKRAPGERVAITAKVTKISDELGLVFGWAFTSQIDGADYFDLQGDAIDQDFVKAAADFMAGGALTDEMHDGEPDGRVLFAMPMTPEIAKAFDVTSKTVGLMVALKPSAEVLAKFKSGEYTGFSIAGMGEREPVDKRDPALKAQWSVAMIDDLPDSSFLYIEPGGTKDGDGKTTPRSLRHFPYKDASGKVDLPHLRNAAARIPQSSLSASLRDKLQTKAEKLIAAQHAEKRARELGQSLRKQVALTDEVDGHQHAIDLDDPADWCGDRLSTTYATSEGADTSHAHVWTFDPDTGAVTIAADSGHTHTVDGVVPPEVMAAFKLDEQAEDAQNARALLERVLDGDAGASDVSVTIASRAPQAKSTPADPIRSVGSQAEKSKMNIAKLLATFLAMSEAQRSYVSKLASDELEPYFSKPAAERETLAKSAADADPVIFKGEASGIEVRKSDGALALQLAKQNEQLAKAQQEQALELAKAKAKTEQVELEKRADADLSHFAKAVGVRAAILKAVDGIADESVRKEALEALKGANAAMKEAGAVKGFNPGDDAAPATKDAAFAKLRDGLVAFCTEHKIEKVWTDGLDAFVKTPAGDVLYQTYETAKKAASAA